MAKPSTPKTDDDDWQADSDARSLMEANRIQSDSKRLARAKKALKTIEEEAERTKLEVKVARGLKKLGGR